MLFDLLPDDVLLEIFDFYMDGTEDEDEDEDEEDKFEKKKIESWQTLVHVCRRWRTVVFGSPRRLNLRLVCTNNTRAGDTLDVWPPLPLSIRAQFSEPRESVDIISVLERSDRVHQINLQDVFGDELEDILKAMQEPFPKLTSLLITRSDDETAETEPVPLPDSFLGGSAPRLETLYLYSIPSLVLPELLLSTTRLTTLYLENIPHSGYISPAAMVGTLSTLTNLNSLSLQFQSPRSFPDQESRRHTPPTRSILPSLTSLMFKGATEYLEDLVTRIDAPQLGFLGVTLFNQIFFESPQLIQFIGRTSKSTLKSPEKAQITFRSLATGIYFSSVNSPNGYRSLTVEIRCRELDWQVSSLEQVCTSCLPPLSTLEDLSITQKTDSEPDWKDNVEDALWLELFHPFSSVKNLYLSEEFAPRIVPALQELVGGRTLEVLPILQNIFVEGLEPSGPIQEGIGKFVVARQVTDHPLAVSRWDRDQDRSP